MFGWGYAVDYCISLFQKEQEERAVQIYFGECLRVITENTARIAGGSTVEAKLKDILDPKPQKNESPEEIIERIRKKLE